MKVPIVEWHSLDVSNVVVTIGTTIVEIIIIAIITTNREGAYIVFVITVVTKIHPEHT